MEATKEKRDIYCYIHEEKGAVKYVTSERCIKLCSIPAFNSEYCSVINCKDSPVRLCLKCVAQLPQGYAFDADSDMVTACLVEKGKNFCREHNENPDFSRDYSIFKKAPDNYGSSNNGEENLHFTEDTSGAMTENMEKQEESAETVFTKLPTKVESLKGEHVRQRELPEINNNKDKVMDLSRKPQVINLADIPSGLKTIKDLIDTNWHNIKEASVSFSLIDGTEIKFEC